MSKNNNFCATEDKHIIEMKQRLAELQYLSDDDRTEEAMLRSRIEEQSSLIMMLKKRADDTLIRAQALERSNEELIAARDVAEEMLQEECKKSQMLDQRFYELSENHEEMIAFKDSYKAENVVLKKENDKLLKQLSTFKSTQDQEHLQQFKDISEQLLTLQKKFSLLQEKLSVSEEVRISQEREYADTISHLNKELQSARSRCLEAESKAVLDGEKVTHSHAALEEAIRARDEYSQLAMQRGKTLQEKQTGLKALQQKLELSEQKMKEIAVKFAKETEAVSVNSQVKKMRDELDLKTRELEELQEGYAAYKEHSSQLLQSEKQLNARLRKLFN